MCFAEEFFLSSGLDKVVAAAAYEMVALKVAVALMIAMIVQESVL